MTDHMSMEEMKRLISVGPKVELVLVGDDFWRREGDGWFKLPSDVGAAQEGPSAAPLSCEQPPERRPQGDESLGARGSEPESTTADNWEVKNS